MWGIIAGSGFEKSESVIPLKELNRNTAFGLASSGLKHIKVGDHDAIFLPRHGAHHELLPSEINFRANILALKREGVTQIVSVSAVGSLKREYAPGDLVIPAQYIDRTKGIREATFTGKGIVAHVSLAQPVSPVLCSLVKDLSPQLQCTTHFGATYVCIEGPYFSTQAESHSYRQIGASIIGMTNFPEFALAREAGIAYLPCCFITDYDCWDENIPHVTVEEVLLQMKKNNICAYDMIPRILAQAKKIDCSVSRQGIMTGLMKDINDLSCDKQELLKVLGE
jgi:5'-methylthioadenosine phosphorylase